MEHSRGPYRNGVPPVCRTVAFSKLGDKACFRNLTRSNILTLVYFFVIGPTSQSFDKEIIKKTI